MVRGCASACGVGNLCFLKPGKTVSTEADINILEAHLIPSIDNLFSDKQIIFQQNLAPAHNLKNNQRVLPSARHRYSGMARKFGQSERNRIGVAINETAYLRGLFEDAGRIEKCNFSSLIKFHI